MIKCWPYIYIISLYLIYFICSSRYLLVCFLYRPWHLSTLITTSLFSVSVHLFLFCYILKMFYVLHSICVKKTYSTCLYLTYFTKHNTLQVHLCCCKWQNFILFCGSVIPSYMYMCLCVYIVVVQSLSHVWLFATSQTIACQAPLSSTISQSLLRFMSIESVMLSDHLIFFCLLLLLPSIFPSIRVFSYGLALCIKWPKYWSFSISLSSDCSRFH